MPASVVVTGAGAIGSAVALEMASQGAVVEVWDSSASALEAMALTQQHSVRTRLVDVLDGGAIDRALTEFVQHCGTIDAMVTTAAIATFAPVATMSEEMWRAMIDVNLTGVFLCNRAAVGAMLPVGRGAIVNISSIGGMRGEPEYSHYCASKFGVIGFSQSLALEVGPDGIRVNCVCPGAVSSEMNTATLQRDARRLGVPYEEIEQRVLAKTALRRLVAPEDIAKTVAFLCSDAAAGITATAVPVTAGVL
jgi:NAD(P)-dependent dehydrogenase (short-subunit alcohol dehydrogenase family)